MQKYDLIIVGAGAAGMLAAIQANAEAPQLRIALLERLPRPGKKLLATGNGRCNIANAAASREHYYNAAGQNPAFVQPALQKYTQQDNLAFFRSMGLLTKQEAEAPFQLAVMVTAASPFPAYRLVTMPVEETTAVSGLLLVQVMAAPSATGRITAFRVTLLPEARVTWLWSRAMA